MKRIIKYFIFTFILMFPLFAYAAGGVTIDKSSLSVAPGGKVSFNITATNAAGTVTISSDNTSVATVDKSYEWVENGTLNVSVTGINTGDTKIKVVVDAATFDKEVVKQTYTISVRVLSTNNNLGSLTISGGTLSPGFSAGVTSYSATVDAASVTIGATAADSRAKVSGTGVKSLNYGNNSFSVVVTSEAGTTKTYTIAVNRPDNRSTNNYLKSLSISNGSISFNKNTTTYNVDVAADITSIKVDAAVEDAKASFSSGYGSRTVNLNYGKNAVQVKVKAENGSVKTYTINVNRADNRSTNNNLTSLTLSAGSITFSKDTLDYNVSVPFETAILEIVAVPEDPLSTVVINNPELVIGDNVATIVVTSENGSVKTYTLNIKRLSEAEKMSDNNKITSIDIFGHDFDLLDGVFEYDIKVGSNEKDLLFNILMEDERANYIIDGNKSIKDGSVVTIKAISESGIETEYIFNISKEAIKSSKSNFGMYIIACIVCLFIGFGAGFFTPRVIEKLKPALAGAKGVVPVKNDLNSDKEVKKETVEKKEKVEEEEKKEENVEE